MILCCGEALIDMIPRRIPGEGEAYLPIAGGAIFNTAIALGRLSEETGFVSALSTDLFGDQLIEALETSSVSSDYCVRSKQPTTLAFVKLNNGQAEYSFFDENSACRSFHVAALPGLPETARALHFGAISLIPEPCGTAFETLLGMHCDRTVISLDPNIRESFIGKPDSHRARILRMIAKSDIVKISDEDLDWIAPGADKRTAIGQWIEIGTKLVLLTEGAGGVTAFTRTGEIHQSACRVKVVDTIGAGDTFNAGLLSGLNERGVLSKSGLSSLTPENLQHALKKAVRVAAFTVSRAGATPPWVSELTEIRCG